MRASPALACLVLFALAGCEREQRREAGSPQVQAEPQLTGAWATETPATFSGEGLRTETTEGRTTYRPDGSFAYTGRLTIYGEKLPAGGVPFRIEADGKWRRQARLLTEDFTSVRVTPEVPNQPIAALAKQLGDEIAAQPASQSDILEFTATGLMLRDKESGKVSTYTRL